MSGNRRDNGKKTAYSAVATALALVMIVISAYLPVTVAPLIVVALAWNIVFDKCGWAYGALSIAATVGLGFLTVIGAGLGIMIIVGIVFVPYSLLAFFLKNLKYSGIRTSAARILIMSAFASLAFMCLYFSAQGIAGYIDLYELISRISFDNFALGYAVLNLIAVALVVGIDIIYIYLRANIIKRLK